MNASNRHDLGLLLLRIGMGAAFIAHGLPKLLGGPAQWEALGSTMGIFGIHFAPTFWGLMAALAETLGGLCLAVGAYFPIACAMLFITMLVASSKHLMGGDGFGKASHAMEAACVFAALWLTGPGSFRVRIGRG